MTYLRCFVILMGFASVAHAETTSLLRIHGSYIVGAKFAPELALGWLKHKGFDVITQHEKSSRELRIIANNKTGERIVVEIRSRGSASAFNGLIAGRADIGMTSRRIRPAEQVRLSRLGTMTRADSEYVIALDGIAIIVHPNSPVQTLNRAELLRVFTGKVTNWSELGLREGKIQVFARDDRSGTFDAFDALVLDGAALTPAAARFTSSDELTRAIGETPAAIGFVGLTHAHDARQVAISDEGSEPMWPVPFNVATEDYVLSRRLFFYVPEKNGSRLAREFAEYTVSRAGQRIAKQLGFTSQEVVATKQSAPAEAPKEYQTLTRDAERLSLNIRFQPGSVKLDNKATRDIGRLVEYMSRPENKSRKLRVFGFADAKETAPYLSLSFSVNRADAVADYLLQAGVETERVRGYGHNLPVAANSTEHGRNYNRRVEVWIH